MPQLVALLILMTCFVMQIALHAWIFKTPQNDWIEAAKTWQWLWVLYASVSLGIAERAFRRCKTGIAA
jgi:hypothetical protein